MKTSRSLSLVPQPCDLTATPVEVARALGHLPGVVFLDSSAAEIESDRRDARFSLVAARPVERVTGHLSSRTDRENLRRRLAETGASLGTQGVDRGMPAGGAIGAIGYEGQFDFGIYPEVLVFDHRRETWLETGSLSEEVDFGVGESESRGPSLAPLTFSKCQSRESFCEGVRKAQDYIAAGDIYQVNLSHRFRATWKGDRREAFRGYERLREVSPAPYAAFLDLGEDRQVLSSSPELFLEMSGNAVRTRPIKGTRPRFRDPARDEKSAYDLITSPKEVAELVMITDLERNDLGQICEYGSVQATDLLKLERYAQVFHLVSTVEGTLRAEVDHIEALAACFPGGSITGAPKKRSREIITEIEPEPRGLYTGCIGMFGFNGESRFNIAIRTAIIESGELHFHAGAGIVADSVPEMEYEETLHKAAGLLAAFGE